MCINFLTTLKRSNTRDWIIEYHKHLKNIKFEKPFFPSHSAPITRHLNKKTERKKKDQTRNAWIQTEKEKITEKSHNGKEKEVGNERNKIMI